jgi:hypothetical protein
MLERSRVLSYVFAATALLAVLIALRIPHRAAAEQAGWVRVDVVPSYHGGR